MPHLEPQQPGNALELPSFGRIKPDRVLPRRAIVHSAQELDDRLTV